MVTNYGGTGDLMCSSTDVKPTDVAVNTRCLELDTGKFWYFNGTTWTETPGGGGGGSATLIEKSITANGTYNARSDNADGFRKVVVGVPNTYTLADEGKVVDSGALEAQTAKNIDANGLYDTTLNNSVNVSVPNSYTVADEGKVVSSGALVSQSAYPSTIVANGTYDTTLNNSVTVNVPIGGEVEEKDVNFIDYDGTIVYSYTAQEFLQLSELPANPTHTGLTAQGWNWSLADAKDYVTDYGILEVGQHYVTDDGTTRLYCTFTDGCLNPYVYINASENSTIDWGDGTTTSVSAGNGQNIPHTYSSAGDYVIALGVGIQLVPYNDTTGYWSSILNDGTLGINSKTHSGYKYLLCLKRVELGTTSSSFRVFDHCVNLQTITTKNNTTEVQHFSFRECNNLRAFVVSPTTQSITEYAFYNNYMLQRLCVNKNLYFLGDNVTYRTAYCIYNAYNLRRLTLAGTSSLTTLPQYVVNYCRNLQAVVLPTYFDTGIGSGYCFAGLTNLEMMVVPAQCIGIQYLSLADCSRLKMLKFKRTTPPTVQSTTFSSLPTTCTIYVPTGSLSAYTSAANYPDPNTYTYVEY